MTRTRSTSRQLEIINPPLFQSHQLDLLSFVSDELGLTPVLAREKEPRTRSPKFHGNIDSNKTFSNLILGDSNHFAVEATKRFIVQEKSDYGMIYIKAESGLGKTHILHAVANELKEIKKSFYIGSPLLMKAMLDNLNLLKEYEFLLIDDVEEVCGNEDLQKKICQLFDYAQMGKMKIIITGAVAPKDLKNCENRLKGKLSVGLMQVIKGLDQNLALGIVESKCKSIQLDLPIEVCSLVTENVEYNAYGLESVLYKLKHISERSHSVVTVEMAQSELNYKKKSKAEAPEEFTKLINDVAAIYRVEASEILGNSRKTEVVLARHVAMYIVREKGGLSFPKIAELFNRDHSSVMYGVERIKVASKGATIPMV